MSSGSGRPAWHKPVLLLAVVLVLAQVIAFVVIRRSRSDQKSNANTNVAVATSDAAVTEQPREEPRIAPVDAAVEVVQQDAAVAAIEETPQTKVETSTEPVEKQPKTKKLSRAELLAQQKKEKEEKRREEERQRQEQEDRERARRKLEQERAAAEQARMAAEVEKQKLAKEKAEAEAAAARAAAEKARLDALARQKEQETPKVDVLVLVLGPSTPSMSAEQIRNVYLGRASVWPNGTTARPMNRPTGTAAAKKFYGSILRMSGGAFVEHWSEIQLSGGGIAPPVISSGKTVVSKVGATTGGFGYVMESELPADTSSVRLVRLK